MLAQKSILNNLPSLGWSYLYFPLLLSLILKYKFTLGCWRNLFLHTPIYNTMCIIYIYFYILSRSILYGFRFLLDICRKVKTVSRTLIFSTSHALGYFIEIISIALATLDKVSLINQLQKLVAVSRGWHSNRLAYGCGRKRQRVAVCVGREVEIQHERVCA